MSPDESTSPQAEMKTRNLERKFVDVGELRANPLNPNEMSTAEFNMLCDNIERMGVTDPILVRPHPDEEGAYRIIGGQHRWEVAKVLGISQVPVTVVTDEEFDSDQEYFQLVRHNIIRGKMSPDKFVKLYQSLSEAYSEEVASEMFGFVEEAEFKKLIKATQKSLPPEMQDDFAEASKEIKSIDDLAKVLNTLFSEHGDTLPYGYMIFDYGGKTSIWLRMESDGLKNMKAIAALCKEKGKALDHVIAKIVAQLATGKLDSVLDKVVSSAPDVVVPEDVVLPTLDFLEKA